ncbi:hypothetical protein B0T19DRAFT_467262 [Cercophora scortea]|uniref:Uncharacterized protein n=1 Tax=Cercophora scortea TaxID=314031 RepID=A0AAE0M5T9_9PEZI|nr:hypothetical protein B0T19DRAFT_467262 [Cercophora scortea]
MAAQVLGGGPQKRTGKTRDAIYKDILGSEVLPTFYNRKRARGVLFIQRDPQHPETTSRRAAKARAYILDGLRTFGFRSPLWSVNTTGADMHHLLHPLRNDGTYSPHDRERSQRMMWVRWRRYQGFRVRNPGVPLGADGANLYFKAIPVPPGPDSLRHSLSYWRSQDRDSLNNSNGASIWKHGDTKARIWTYMYFMQVLSDQTHDLSRTIDHDFGELSLIRCLHTGSQQSRAAVCYWRNIFYVIADYFATQVIVFRWDGEQDADEGRKANPDVARNPAFVDLGMETSWTQGRAAYSYDVYGAPRPDGSVGPILFATSDNENYDPVDYDLTAWHLTRGYEKVVVVNPPLPPPFVVPPGLPAWAVPAPRPPPLTQISRQIHHRFRAAFDLDGLGFDMPPGEIIKAWRDHHRDNFVTPRYGLVEQPWQLRLGPEVEGLSLVGDYTQFLGYPEIEFEDLGVFGRVSNRVLS